MGSLVSRSWLPLSCSRFILLVLEVSLSESADDTICKSDSSPKTKVQIHINNKIKTSKRHHVCFFGTGELFNKISISFATSINFKERVRTYRFSEFFE